MEDDPADFLSGKWSHLGHLQLGRYAEYLVTMAFTLHGCEVFSSEVDDRGIDLVIRSPNGEFHEIQVKSSCKGAYVFFPKDRFPLGPRRWAAVVRFIDREAPTMFLIPSTAWREPQPPLSDRDYEEGKSRPEWGLSLARKWMPALERYAFQTVVSQISGG